MTNRSSVALIAALVLLACGGDTADETMDDTLHGDVPAGVPAADFAALQRYAASFGSRDSSRAAGYTDQATTCWYHAVEGGQGYHYVRPNTLDSVVSLLEPELVMYEPMPDQSMTFLAVEYVVPFAAWTRADPPMMLGQSFMRNERLELWVLHVWLGKENPNGLFANWNPNVSCAHAAESEDRS